MVPKVGTERPPALKGGVVFVLVYVEFLGANLAAMAVAD
jgi:hypothetical protein